MIGLRSIASFVPPQSISNYDRREEFALTDEFIEHKLGVHSVSRMRSDDDTSSLCGQAFERLQAKVDVSPADIDCLIVCTQNPDGHGIPHTSAVVHGKIGASERCASFDVSLGCSGYVYALSIAKSFMEANGLAHGLLFTADPYSKILNPVDKNTVLLFGDAATVTLLQADGPWMARRFLFATRGKEGKALNNASGRLEMNGRAVFNFSATEVPPQVKALLAAEAVAADDVDLFLFHQGSRYIVDALAKRLNLPPQRIPCNLAKQGNTVSSSIPLLFERYMNDPAIHRVLMSGFGVGLSWASCLLERRV
jgi:3-oxoacyl-[acyl-carrier-protein] synthase III